MVDGKVSRTDRRAENMSLDKREFNGDASLLLGVEQLGPLAGFPFATRPITEHLHSLGSGWYLLVGDRPIVEDGLPKETVRACMVVWARDVTGAMLATGCDDAVRQFAPEPPNSLPPAEIFVPATGWSYGELVKAGRGKLMERGTYGSDGVWRCKELWFPKVSVYFRSRRRKNAELPFAISIVGPKTVDA
jgi:hypothetical protein